VNPVALTSLMVAAVRAEESKRSDRLFDDPLASALAGSAGVAGLDTYRAALRLAIPTVLVRTRWIDDALLRAAAAGTTQVVILGAGMDARAYRLPWAAGTRVFEIDQPEVIAYKAQILASSSPRGTRVAIGEDLANDWPAALRSAGFDRAVPTAWLVEGVTSYLDEPAVEGLFARIDQLSVARSTVLYDILSMALLRSAALAPGARRMTELGAPWTYGSDDPTGPIARHGWEATAVDPSEVGARLGRWPLPPAAAPPSYLVEGVKHRVS
jgi:methyltransferase (TIGR00027 family)